MGICSAFGRAWGCCMGPVACMQSARNVLQAPVLSTWPSSTSVLMTYNNHNKMGCGQGLGKLALVRLEGFWGGGLGSGGGVSAVGQCERCIIARCVTACVRFHLCIFSSPHVWSCCPSTLLKLQACKGSLMSILTSDCCRPRSLSKCFD